MFDVWKEINTMPREMLTIVVFIVSILVIAIRWLWNNIVKKWIKNKRDELYEKERDKERLLYKVVETETRELHHAMKRILKNCYRRGYRSDLDVEEFMGIYHNYKEIGGNTDGEVLYHDFLVIPYKTTLQVPQRMGVEYPSKEANDIMHDFYIGVKDKRIPEHDINPVHNITTQTKKEE